MNKPQLNLQDVFLNQVRKENISVTIYLIGGVQLRGLVRGFDAFTVLLDSVGTYTRIGDANRVKYWLETGETMPAPRMVKASFKRGVIKQGNFHIVSKNTRKISKKSQKATVA